jgi:N-acetylmuramoyl-L-alanine amidase CwlA
MPLLTIKREPISINYHAGRESAYAVDMIVVHVTEGSAQSVVEWFNDPTSEVSAHYMVRKDGVVVQFVEEEDTAWHAGRVNAPTADLVLDRAPANPNGYSIGIEHEGDGKESLTLAQRIASVGLIRDICARGGIAIDRRHIVGHHEIYAPKLCPGAISVDALVKEAAKAPTPAPDSPVPLPSSLPRVVYSPQLADYLIVTRYVSDAEWYFVPAKLVGRYVEGSKAGTPLSKMPLTKADA